MSCEPMTSCEFFAAKRCPHEREIHRIREKLGQFLSLEEAHETAACIYDLAFDVDEELTRILSDPLVSKFYEYDGLFFTPRGTHLFHRAFNGIHILQSLNNEKIETFFRGRKKADALHWLMDELGKHIWEAKIRRLHWEESGTLSTVSREVIEAIVQDVRERRRRAAEARRPLSAEQQAFFQPYENQMGTRGSKDPTATVKS